MAKKNDDAFIPVGDRVLIRRIKITENKTDSGIILPENHKKKMFENLAQVIVVGDGENISDRITSGCTVFVHDDAKSIELDADLGLHVIHPDSIVGVVN